MEDETPHIGLNVQNVQLTFNSDRHPSQDLVWVQSDISITCLSPSLFYKVFDNDKNAQCGIHHMCTVASQKCDLCQLHSYRT